MFKGFSEFPNDFEICLTLEPNLKVAEMGYFLENRRNCFLFLATLRFDTKNEFNLKADSRIFEIGEINRLTHNRRWELFHLKVLIVFIVIGYAISAFKLKFVFTYNHQVN